jgi:histidyl-tRNA synthetase
VDLPALGFGMGDVVLLELLQGARPAAEIRRHHRRFVLIEDELLRAQSLKLTQICALPATPWTIRSRPPNPDKQFKRAQELKVGFTARVESDDYVRIRNLKTREEVVAGFADVANHLG